MVFYVVVLISYVCLTVFTSRLIGKSILLTRRQKTANIVLNALIPVAWIYLIYPVIFPADKIITREEREKMIARENGSRLGC